MATKNNRASRYAAPIGGIFIVLCVIGFFSLISTCFQFTRNMLDNSGVKYDYEKLLLPVVMFDPSPFENPTNIRQVDLLTYSVWAAVLGDKRDIYEYDDNMSMVIPASDVDMAAYKLFGPEVVLQHSSFGDYEIAYLYDEATKSYHVPVNAMTGYYIPQVEEIIKDGDIVRLTVGYIPPANILDINLGDRDMRERKPDKHMTYVLHKNKKDYYLYSIGDAEEIMPGGSAANPLLQDMMDDLNDPNAVAGDPAGEMMLLPQSKDSSEGASSGSSSDGSSSSASSSGGSSSSGSSSGSSSSGGSSSGSESKSGSSESSTAGTSPVSEVEG